MQRYLVTQIIDAIEYIFHLRLKKYLRANLGQPSIGDVIFDVGANIGSTSKIYMKLYRSIKIIAFEPLPIFRIKSN